MDNRFYLHALGITGLFVVLLLMFWVASGGPASEAELRNASGTRTSIALTEGVLLRPFPTSTPSPFLILPTFVPPTGLPGSTLSPAMTSTSTSFPRQSSTPIPSLTPLPTAASHAQPTKAPPLVPRSESGAQTPDQFVRWYFSRVWRERDYQNLWDNYLTASFKTNVGSGLFEDYVGWWDSVERVNVNSVEVLENNGTDAWVRVNLTFRMKDGRVVRDQIYEYDFLYDPTRGTWMFDSSA